MNFFTHHRAFGRPSSKAEIGVDVDRESTGTRRYRVNDDGTKTLINSDYHAEKKAADSSLFESREERREKRRTKINEVRAGVRGFVNSPEVSTIRSTMRKAGAHASKDLYRDSDFSWFSNDHKASKKRKKNPESFADLF